MRKSVIVVTGVVAICGAAWAAGPGPKQQAVLDHFTAEAKAADPQFKGFSAEAGKTLFFSKPATGKPDTPGCTTCHTTDLTKPGQTRAGKVIEPMAASVNPKRFSDLENVQKWLLRNCSTVLGRECTLQEKGNVLTFLTGI